VAVGFCKRSKYTDKDYHHVVGRRVVSEQLVRLEIGGFVRQVIGVALLVAGRVLVFFVVVGGAHLLVVGGGVLFLGHALLLVVVSVLLVLLALLNNDRFEL
jgi:hypothetical protein